MKNLLILLIILLLTGCSQAPNTQAQQDNTPILGINNLSGKQYSLMASKISTSSTGSGTNLTGSKTQDETSKSVIKEINKPEIGLKIKFDPSLGEIEYVGSDVWKGENIQNPRSLSYGENKSTCKEKSYGIEPIIFPYEVMINSRKIYYSNSRDLLGEGKDYISYFCFDFDNTSHQFIISSSSKYHKTLRERLLGAIEFEKSQPEIFVNSGVGFSIKLPTKGDDKSKNILVPQGEGFDRRDINNRKTHNFIIVDVKKNSTNSCGQRNKVEDFFSSFEKLTTHNIELYLSNKIEGLTSNEQSSDILGYICFKKGKYNISILINEPTDTFDLVRREIISGIRIF